MSEEKAKISPYLYPNSENAPKDEIKDINSITQPSKFNPHELDKLAKDALSGTINHQKSNISKELNSLLDNAKGAINSIPKLIKTTIDNAATAAVNNTAIAAINSANKLVSAASAIARDESAKAVNLANKATLKLAAGAVNEVKSLIGKKKAPGVGTTTKLEYELIVGNFDKPEEYTRRYSNNEDKHLGPHHRGYEDVKGIETLVPMYWDLEIKKPEISELNLDGNSGVLSKAPKPVNDDGSPLDLQAEVTNIKTVSISGGDESYDLSNTGSVILNLRLQRIASISTRILEDSNMSVYKWLSAYKNALYGDEFNYSVNVVNPIFQYFYFLTYYFLSPTRKDIWYERTFWGVPQFDLSLMNNTNIKEFNIDWLIIGES